MTMTWEDEIQVNQNISNHRNIIPGNGFFCMFSGGKDSGLAMSIAIEKGGCPIGLIHITEENESLYHRQSMKVIEAQAKAMNVKLYYMRYKWWHNWERAYSDLKDLKGLGANYLVFGDIRPKYIIKGDIPLCVNSGFEACLPLGEMPYDELMNLFEKHKIVSIITRINHPSIRKDLLGIPFSREIYCEFCKLGIDPLGENDEFHTTLVDADFYNAPLNYSLNKNGEDMVSVSVIS